MAHELLRTDGWQAVTDRLGGQSFIEKSARDTRAFVRGREIESALVLLRR
jgi:hypothetical protein